MRSLMLALPGARHSSEQQLRRGTTPLGRLPRARGALRGLEARLERTRYEYGRVPAPAASVEEAWLYTSGY